MAENMVNWESRAHHMESVSWDKALILHRQGTKYLIGHFECRWLYIYGNLPWINSHEVNEDWNIWRGKKMRLDLKRCLCFFFVAFLGVGFRSGALSRVASSQCNGSIAQCYYQQESMMESAISGRLLGPVPNNYPTRGVGYTSWVVPQPKKKIVECWIDHYHRLLLLFFILLYLFIY